MYKLKDIFTYTILFVLWSIDAKASDLGITNSSLYGNYQTKNDENGENVFTQSMIDYYRYYFRVSSRFYISPSLKYIFLQGYTLEGNFSPSSVFQSSYNMHALGMSLDFSYILSPYYGSNFVSTICRIATYPLSNLQYSEESYNSLSEKVIYRKNNWMNFQSVEMELGVSYYVRIIYEEDDLGDFIYGSNIEFSIEGKLIFQSIGSDVFGGVAISTVFVL